MNRTQLQRLTYLRKNILRLSQAEFSEKINYDRSWLSLIENEKREISDKFLDMISAKFNVNKAWLKFGEGEIFLPTIDPEDELLNEISGLEVLKENNNLNEDDIHLIKNYIGMKEAERTLIINQLKMLKKLTSGFDI